MSLSKITKRIKKWEHRVRKYVAETNPIVDDIKKYINDLKPQERQLLADRYGKM